VPQWIEYALRGGNVGLLAFAAYILWTVKGRLDRDESLRKDYPPHRHINGTKILYPQEYPPAKIERFEAGD
jgi:hypothetical protein